MATLSVVGFFLWVTIQPAPGEPGEGIDVAVPAEGEPISDEQGRTETAPCMAPVTWHVAEIDSRFGITRAEARRAVARATELWERAARRSLFTEDSEAGMPIRFTYDARQERLRDRIGAQNELRATDADLERRREEIERRDGELRAALAGHAERVRELDEDVARHNREVRQWNESGGTTEDVARELAEREGALEARRARLEREARALSETGRAIEAEVDRLSTDVDARNHAADQLERTYAPERVESGIYRHTVRQRADGTVAVSPEIQVFAFESESELVSVLAHELGHALGLGHVDAPGALMSAEHSRITDAGRSAVVDSADVAALVELCPPSARPDAR